MVIRKNFCIKDDYGLTVLLPATPLKMVFLRSTHLALLAFVIQNVAGALPNLFERNQAYSSPFAGQPKVRIK